MRLGGTVSVPVPQAVWLEGGQAAAGPVAAIRLYINVNIVTKHFLPLPV